MPIPPQLPFLPTADIGTDSDLVKIFDISDGLEKMVHPEALVAAALSTKQDVLVSGTNIKTINSTSLLGSGNISIAATPAGTAGQIQFSDGSAFAADSNLFWDNTNKRLGVGTSTPGTILHLKQNTTTQGVNLRFEDNSNFLSVVYQGSTISSAQYIGFTNGTSNTILRSYGNDTIGIGATTTPTARLQVKGTGSTSATTSLLVQNSSGTELLKVDDAGNVGVGTIDTNYKLNVEGTGVTWARVKSSSNSGYSALTLGTNNNNTRFVIYAFSSSYSSIGQYQANASLLEATGDFYLTASNFRFYNGNLVVGTAAANTSAIADIQSTTKGFLPPRMTTTQKNAISSPAEGLMVMDITTHKLCVYDGTSWVDLH